MLNDEKVYDECCKKSGCISKCRKWKCTCRNAEKKFLLFTEYLPKIFLGRPREANRKQRQLKKLEVIENKKKGVLDHEKIYEDYCEESGCIGKCREQGWIHRNVEKKFLFFVERISEIFLNGKSQRTAKETKAEKR